MKRKIVVLSIGAVFLVCASALFAEDRLVPSVYPTIQAGIDAAVPGDAVVIAAGTYTGAGNRDLDFGGSAITVRSADPNNPDVVAATIIDCQGSGRGFYFQSGETSSSVLAGLTITNGYDAVFGGGVYCYGSSPTIEKCTFSTNNASMGGGGVAIESCSPMVVNCVFSGNTGGWYGGGINNYDSSAIVKGCIFSGNGASAGGGLVNFESSATTINCTFSGNYADQGGGIYNYDSSSSSLSNCILWGDTAPDEPEIYGDCSVSYSDVQGGYPGEGNIDADPCFADPVGGDYHLLEDSPCIDAGDPGYSPAPGERDIDGEPRVVGLFVDMGAYEFPIDRPIIEVWPGEFEFFAGVGGPNPATQVLSIRNIGPNTLNWQITEDCPWLNAAPSSGESSGEVNEVTISVDVSGLAWGQYNCELTVSDPCAFNSPQTVDVNLAVIGPVIEVSAAMSEFVAVVDGPNPPDQELGIRNSGGGRLNWEISEDCGWLSVEPNSGSSTGEVNQVTLSVDVAGLTEASYYCELIVSDPNAENNPQMVDVDLTIRVPEALHVPSEYPTIQWAIDAAVDGDTVVIAPGTYTGAGNRDIDFKGKGITVESTDPSDPNTVAATIIDCQGSETEPHRGFYFHSNEQSNSVIDGLTITNGFGHSELIGGYETPIGGGIYCYQSSPTIKNCVITNNRAYIYEDYGGLGFHTGGFGGGIYCYQSNPEISSCTITDNKVCIGDWWGHGFGRGGLGGGIYCKEGNPTISNCTITHNGTEWLEYTEDWYPKGGGIYVYGGNANISDCTIRDNYSGHSAGGIYCWAPATIEDCDISNNESGGFGGGLSGGGGTTVSNCTISGNTTFIEGGGIDGSMVIANCVICQNTAWGSPDWMGIEVEAVGGGISCSGSSRIINCTVSGNAIDWGHTGGVYCSGSPSISNCIMWGNVGAEISHGSPEVTHSDVQGGWAGIGNIDADPCFVSGPLGDFYLSQIAAGQASDSPCVDAGSDTAYNLGMDMYTTRTDEIGDAGIVDMGYHSMPNPADIDGDGDVDEVDYAILASQWRKAPGVPSADIAPPGGDGIVDEKDLGMVAHNYLWGK